jgi:hypothetical protein
MRREPSMIGSSAARQANCFVEDTSCNMYGVARLGRINGRLNGLKECLRRVIAWNDVEVSSTNGLRNE